jgi:hypothetical protein
MAETQHIHHQPVNDAGGCLLISAFNGGCWLVVAFYASSSVSGDMDWGDSFAGVYWSQ